MQYEILRCHMHQVVDLCLYHHLAQNAEIALDNTRPPCGNKFMPAS